MHRSVLALLCAAAHARIGPPPSVTARKLHAHAARSQLVLASIAPPQAILKTRSSDELLDAALTGLKFFSYALDISIFAPFLGQLPVLKNLMRLEPVRMVLTPIEIVTLPYFAAWRAVIPKLGSFDISYIAAFYAVSIARKELMKVKMKKLRVAHDEAVLQERDEQMQIAGGDTKGAPVKAVAVAVGGAAVSGLAITAFKLRQRSSLGDGGVAELGDVAE